MKIYKKTSLYFALVCTALFNLAFANPINDNNIETFTLKKARLLNQSFSSSADGVIKVQLNYKTYINKK